MRHLHHGLQRENQGLPRGAVHCITVLSVQPKTLGSRPCSVAAGRDWEVRGAKHNWLSVVWVREGLASRDCTPATPVVGRVQCALAKVARCTV